MTLVVDNIFLISIQCIIVMNVTMYKLVNYLNGEYKGVHKVW